MNQLKLRVSYGVNGSNAIPVNSAFGLLGRSNYSSEGQLVKGYIPTSGDNVDLGWQKTDSWDIGLDVSLFRNRISLAVDYYVKSIRDMLYRITLPAVIGYTSGYTNVGNIENKGLEVELKTENLTGKLRWTTSLALGFNKNKVKSLGDNSAIYTGFDNSTQVIEVGRTAGEYYLYDAVGVYQTQEDLKKYPTQTGSVVGSVRYRDVNGDGQITEADRIYCGHPQPSVTYGLTNTFKYKNWDLSLLITAQTGGKIYGVIGRAIDRQGMGVDVNALKRWQNMWFSESDPGDGHTPNAWVSGISEEYDTRWLYSSDFIKLKNITLGYRFKLPKKYYVNLIRLNASIENVFMIDSYDGGFSPESNNATSRISNYDYGAYPQARTFNVGVTLLIDKNKMSMIKINKKVFGFIGLVVFVFHYSLLTSCSDYLEVNPANALRTGTYYATESQVNDALNGLYGALKPVPKYEFCLSEMRSDNVWITADVRQND